MNTVSCLCSHTDIAEPCCEAAMLAVLSLYSVPISVILLMSEDGEETRSARHSCRRTAMLLLCLLEASGLAISDKVGSLSALL